MRPLRRSPPEGRTTLVYLARGADLDFRAKFDRFVRAYAAHPAGIAHDLVVIFKGFPSDDALAEGRRAFAALAYQEVHTDDLAFDIGAYAQVARQTVTDRICFLNTNSEPCADNWLLKLALNLEQPGIGLVGATGSYQSFDGADYRFPPAPSLHVRSNAFMLRGQHARDIVGGMQPRTKREAYLAESGRHSITRQVIALGLSVLIVGRNGRGYAPEWWSSSGTSCQGAQENLLVHDNHTRFFENIPIDEKRDIYDVTWRGLPGPPYGCATP